MPRNLKPFCAHCKEIVLGFTLAAIICTALPSPLLAVDSPVNRLQSPQAQNVTIRALQAMDQGRWDLGRDLIAQTHDPLAAKLYYWMIFAKRNEIPNYSRMAQMVRGNPEWPRISAIRRKAEELMPYNSSAAEVIAWFDDYTPETAAGIERYIDALLQTRHQTRAREVLGEWWASNTLSRDDQRHLFRKYKSYLSMQAHERRFDNMLYKGHYANARAIAGILGPGYPELAEARIALAEEKGSENAYIAKVPPNLRNDPGLLYERLRWRRKNDLDTGAMEILHKMPPAEQIQNLPAWWRERHILIRRMIERKSWKSAYLLAAGHKQESGLPFAQGEWLAGWLALRFLDDRIAAYQHFDKLYRGVSSPISRARAAYWAGRSADSFSDKTVSQRWYQIAAQFQTVFYGQMAAAELGKDGQLPDYAPPRLSAAQSEAFARAELMQAAVLFARAGMKHEAGLFLRAFVEHENSSPAYFYAATQAANMGMLYDAVKISKDATQNGMFLTAQSYPVITDKLKGIDTEWALIHGIIRQESMFDERARSPAGALGMMQLMPATAREVAGKLGVSYSPSALTLDPAYNIRLGSTYLSEMVRRFDGSYPLAIAAYNGGPGRVGKWLEILGDPRTGQVDLIDWIEMIPVYETRNYVQRVLEATYVYRLRLQSLQPPSKAPLHIAMAGKHSG